MPASADGAGEPQARDVAHAPARTGAGSERLRIALFVEEGGGDWHARRLMRAIEARGAEVVVTSLSLCAFDTAAPSGLEVPGFDGRLPGAAFVRSVSAGSLEQITMRLGILHALEAAGITVWNNARAIERCVDKSTATWRFQRAGLPVPATRVAEGLDAAAAWRQGRGTLVAKPLFGSQGNGVRRLAPGDPLPPAPEVGSVYYLQEYVRGAADSQFEDWRVFVSAGRILATMTRRGTSWLTNVHQGAEPIAHEPDDEMRRLALAAARAVGADYAGVDLIRASDGRLLVLEINSNPAWKGLQSVTDRDIAATLAGDFLAAVAAGARVTPAAPA